MEKFDVKRAHPELYRPSARAFTVVEVPPQRSVAIDGHGDPNTAADYAAALEALYTVAYAAKSASRRDLQRDFVVAPLEGLWRIGEGASATLDKTRWDWTMLITLPDWIDETAIDRAVDAAGRKRALPALPLLRPLALDEGTCVQIMHLGSFDDEAPTIARLHDEYMPEHGLTFNGDHHEIYLSDPRRTEPAKMRTVLRQPVRPAG